jgi:endonuclease/exonuclease/phosphatase family metal-dependent hydrolase
VLIRTWNLFHGNTLPPGRRAYLREMVELVTADRPDVVCLQEVPAWALGRLGPWAGMTELPALARPASIGPLRIPSALGRALTAPNHGLIRSAFAGQGNSILLRPDAQVIASAAIRINPDALRAEPRVAQRVECRLADGPRVTVANLHCTNSPDPHVCDAQLERSLRWAERATPAGVILILAGDVNVTPERSEVLPNLGPGFSSPVPASIDQILVRDAVGSTARIWAEEERRYGSKLLSDHAPVELTIEL